MFADNIVFVDENINMFESKLEYWHEILEKKGLNISRSITIFLEFIKFI